MRSDLLHGCQVRSKTTCMIADLDITLTYPKTNMNIQNDGLEKVDSFGIWLFLVSTLDFWGVAFFSTYLTLFYLQNYLGK